MTAGFTVAASQLSEASTGVGEVGSSIKECVTAANTEGVGGLVYGVLFDPTMLPILSDAKDSLADMIGSVADAANAIAKGLKNNSATYDSVEKFLQSHFATLQGQADDGGR
jgi:hypothetical protein